MIVAIALGALVVNTPARRWLQLSGSTERDSDVFEPGLRFTGKWLLRAAIILMGLKFELRVFQSHDLWFAAAVIVFSVPTAYLVAQFFATRLGLRRELGDLISIGVMICGASAINALAPVVGARRREQGLAITAVFLFSVGALLVFHPIGVWLELTDTTAGLWSGLAINDLAGSVAVGTQFSGDAALLAAAAKSLRVALLGPCLLVFALLQRRRGAVDGTGASVSLKEHLPRFVLGYLALFLVRFAGDALFGAAPGWLTVLAVNDTVVKVLMLTVSAGIGLAIDGRSLLAVGWRAVIAGGAASVSTAVVCLGMISSFAEDAQLGAFAFGSVAVAGAGVLYAVGRQLEPESLRLERLLQSGGALTLREAVDLLDLRDAAGEVTPQLSEQVVRQLHPAIGELQPLREAEVVPGTRYRRLPFWVSKKGDAELVAILWLPGVATHIHSHDAVGLGKTVEGGVEVLNFKRAGNLLTLSERSRIAPGELVRVDSTRAVHMVRNALFRDAIDLHFYRAVPGAVAERFDPTSAVKLDELRVGEQVEVAVTLDLHPAPARVRVPRARLTAAASSG